MRILIACEYSGTERDAFIAAGHDAVSCDLLPSERPGPHYHGDVLKILNDGWDMMIAHPPCTYLSASGMHWTTRGLRDPQLTEDALEFVRALMNCSIPRWCIENPVGAISTHIRKFDQMIQPYDFGDDASKRTCLWLRGLPPLKETMRFPGRMVEWPRGSGKLVERWGNQTDSGQNKLPPSSDRWQKRSTSFAGIAAAMAAQWSII